MSYDLIQKLERKREGRYKNLKKEMGKRYFPFSYPVPFTSHGILGIFKSVSPLRGLYWLGLNLGTPGLPKVKIMSLNIKSR